MKDRRKTVSRVVLWALVVLWMGVIFWFSAEKAQDSDQTSGRVIRWLLSHFDSEFLSLSPEEQLLMIGDWSHVVSKLAHFCLFGMLGCLSFAAFSVDLPLRRAFPAALGLCVVRAVLDEVHQSFTPGRSCEVRDMAIDAAGAALGILFLFLLFSLVNRKKRSTTK